MISKSEFLKIETSNASALEVWHQVITHKFLDRFETEDYKGSAYRFGFTAFSLLLFNFTIWLHSNAKNKGIKKLYFLSRDGKILFDYFNRLFPSSNIDTYYIYTSRRALKSITIYEESDILKSLNNFKTLDAFSVTTFLDYLCGLELTKDIKDVFFSYGFIEYDEPLIINEQQRNNFLKALLHIKDTIINNSKIYRSNYISYLQSNGLNTSTINSAVVDIGYECTAQATISTLLKNDHIHGFYFGTFQEALFKIKNLKYADSYLFNFSSRLDDPYSFVSNVEIIETLVCDYNDSFIRFELNKDNLTPVFFNIGDKENVSKSIIKRIHDGALDFTLLLNELYPKSLLLELSPSSPEIAFSLLNNFIQYPKNKYDVRIFEGVKFSYDSINNLSRYVIAPQDYKKSNAREASIWINGEALLGRNDFAPFAKAQDFSLQLENRFLKIILKNKFKRKYINNRWLFFYDSKLPAFRLYFKYLGRFF